MFLSEIIFVQNIFENVMFNKYIQTFSLKHCQLSTLNIILKMVILTKVTPSLMEAHFCPLKISVSFKILLYFYLIPQIFTISEF